jgi:hypothetical protein
MSEPTPGAPPESTVPPLGDEQTSVGDEGPSSVRPRFVLPPIAWRRMAVASIKVGIVIVVASVALGIAAFAAATAYAQYGALKDEPNARAWASLTPRYAGQQICTSCHATEAHAQDASIHVNVSCEDCHGAAADHAGSVAAGKATILAKPTSAVCVTCHNDTAGRPASFPQVDPATHYSGGPCLRCHDPHSIVATRPPVVSHPLTDLPECTTCHAPDGLKKIPAGHEVVGDAVCLSCHGLSASGRP